MVDVSCWAQPQLGAALASGEHDAEVILARHKKVSLLFLCQLCYAAAKLGYSFPNFPEAHTIQWGSKTGTKKYHLVYTAMLHNNGH